MKHLAYLAAVVTLFMQQGAAATPLTENPALDASGVGIAIAEGGVGLETLGAGTANLSVNIGGPVVTAVLYWAGRVFPVRLGRGRKLHRKQSA